MKVVMPKSVKLRGLACLVISWGPPDIDDAFRASFDSFQRSALALGVVPGEDAWGRVERDLAVSLLTELGTGASPLERTVSSIANEPIRILGVELFFTPTERGWLSQWWIPIVGVKRGDGSVFIQVVSPSSREQLGDVLAAGTLRDWVDVSGFVPSN
jgi:hypothetical protein